jgi:hypothetical protein
MISIQKIERRYVGGSNAGQVRIQIGVGSWPSRLVYFYEIRISTF